MKISNEIIAQGLNKISKKLGDKQAFASLLKGEKGNGDSSLGLKQMDVDDFKAALKKYGAVGFIAKMSEDIIGEKIAQKRAELEEKMGLNDPNKTQQDIVEIRATIDELVRDFERELKTSLKQSAILQKQKQLSTTSESHALSLALAQI